MSSNAYESFARLGFCSLGGVVRAIVGLACLVFLAEIWLVSIAKADFLEESIGARDKEDYSHNVAGRHSQRAGKVESRALKSKIVR